MTMDQEKINDAVRKLNAINGQDKEVEHSDADTIIVEFLPEEIRQAYQNAQQRSGGWWYA